MRSARSGADRRVRSDAATLPRRRPRSSGAFACASKLRRPRPGWSGPSSRGARRRRRRRTTKRCIRGRPVWTSIEATVLVEPAEPETTETTPGTRWTGSGSIRRQSEFRRGRSAAPFPGRRRRARVRPRATVACAAHPRESQRPPRDPNGQRREREIGTSEDARQLSRIVDNRKSIDPLFDHRLGDL